MKRSPLLRAGKTLSVLFAAALAVSLNPRPAAANPELDRQFALETVGFLKSSDNVDGLFADYVSQAYKEFFAKQSRFILQDISKADTVLASAKLPYNKLIMDNDILGQVARSTKSQSVIRTKIQKEGHQYRFTIDWLHSPKMDRLATDTFLLNESQENQAPGLGDVRAELEKAMDRLVAKLPFKASITGRDNSSVTVNIGTNAELHPGDTLVVATLDEVKKHPLLHEIVDWRFTRTGKVEVTSVEDALSFGKITEEDEGHQIARYQKVLQIIPRAAAPEPIVINENQQAKVDALEMPRLGYVLGGISLGGFGRDVGNGNVPAASSTGSGFAVGGHAEGQLWLNREFFADLGFGYQMWSETMTDTSAGSPNGSQGVGGGSLGTFLIDFGYSYLVTGDFFGPKGWIKLGYHSASYSLPTESQGGITVSAPVTFHSLFLGVGGDLPIRDEFGAIMNFNFGLLPGASEDGKPSGNVNSSTDISFFVGGYYRLTPRMTIRAGFDLQANTVDFSPGTTASSRVLSFSPSLLYYF